MISTSVDVSFLSKIFVSRANFANFALSIRAVDSLPLPNAQKLLNMSSIAVEMRRGVRLFVVRCCEDANVCSVHCEVWSALRGNRVQCYC